MCLNFSPEKKTFFLQYLVTYPKLASITVFSSQSSEEKVPTVNLSD